MITQWKIITDELMTCGRTEDLFRERKDQRTEQTEVLDRVGYSALKVSCFDAWSGRSEWRSTCPQTTHDTRPSFGVVHHDRVFSVCWLFDRKSRCTFSNWFCFGRSGRSAMSSGKMERNTVESMMSRQPLWYSAAEILPARNLAESSRNSPKLPSLTALLAKATRLVLRCCISRGGIYAGIATSESTSLVLSKLSASETTADASAEFSPGGGQREPNWLLNPGGGGFEDETGKLEKPGGTDGKDDAANCGTTRLE